MMTAFDYAGVIFRNLAWVAETKRAALRDKKIALPR